MKPSVNANIHNRFDVVKRNIMTGEETRYYAENIVLDQMYTRLCARSTFFVYIAYGTGTGILAATRTSLFTHKGMAAATTDATSKALPTSWWRRYITLASESEVGTIITELGVAYGSSSSNLVTHAMLRDMNGNIVSLEKTSLDVLTIYATIYSTFSTEYDGVKIAGMPDNNPLVNYFTGSSFSTCNFYTGTYNQDRDEYSGAVNFYLAASAAVSWTADTANKKMTTDTKRFGIDSSNGDIAEVGLGSSAAYGLLTLKLPDDDIYSGLELEDVTVGTGDGETADFYLPSANVDLTTLAVKVDGAANTGFTTSTPDDRTYRTWASNLYDTGAATLTISTMSKDGFVLAFVMSSILTFLDFTNGTWKSRDLPSGVPSVASLSLSEDGDVFAILGTDSKVYVYDWDGSAWSERPICDTDATSFVKLSDDGDTVLTGNVTKSPHFSIYDWSGSAWSVRPDPDTSYIVSAPKSAAISANKNIIAICKDSVVDIYDWDGTDLIFRTKFAINYASYVALSDDGTVFACGFAIGTAARVYSWNGSAWAERTGLLLPTTNGKGITMSADGTRLICNYGSKAACILKHWTGTGWELESFPSPFADTVCANSDLSIVFLGNSTTSGAHQVRYHIQNDRTQLTFATPPGLVTAEAVGTGDALETDFALDNTPTGSLIVKLNGVATEAYTLDGATITFTAAPGSGVVITADYKYAPVITASYTVNGIHKTTQRVIDISAEIAFGEVT